MLLLLLLSIFLLSSCFSGSMGNATEEFKENFKAVVALASEEDFIPVPPGRFQCSLVRCYLQQTTEKLKAFSEDDQMRRRISVMEKNVDHIVSTLSKGRTRPTAAGSCSMSELSPQRALERYRRFFQKLHEKC